VSGEPRSVLALWIVLPLCAAVGAYFSVSMLVGAVKPAPLIGPALVWVLLCLWAAVLLVLIVRPFNVAVMKLLGARPPRPEERRILDRTWRDVLDQVDVPSNRFTLLVVDAGRANAWLHCDLGPYVVAIDQEVIEHLDFAETAAILLQRLARQKSHLALLVGVCLWAAAPLLMILALGVMAFRAVRGIGRALSSAGDRVNPKTESQAAVGLIFYAIGLVCLLGLLVLGVALAIVALFALLMSLVATWLARRAELAADLVAAHWGRGRALRRGLARLDEWSGPPAARTLRGWIAGQFSTHIPTRKRVAHLAKAALDYPQLEADPGS
jgi:hypothetical protein